MPDETVKQNAMKVLPLLVYQAQKGDLLTYGDVYRETGVFYRNPLSNALGYIRDKLCAPRKLPLLNVLVVRADTMLPGRDFLAEGTESLSDIEFQEEFEKHKQNVFEYDRWGELLTEYSLKPYKKKSG